MLVFGDSARRQRAVRKTERVRWLLSAAQAVGPGIQRHALLVEALVEAGELAQGVADARFHAAGQRELPSTPVDATMALTVALARLCARSWCTGFAEQPETPQRLLAACEALLAGETIEVRQPEGFAFYALYPEAYLAAARTLGARPWHVIGLRSIGTSLAAMVAVALDDPSPATCRPVGHPFERRVSIGPRTMAPASEMHHAVVDEGPGLSGSSMAAVVRRLRQAGVPAQRIHLFPGHGNGPGPRASAEVRALWKQSPVHVADFDQLILDAPAPVHRLSNWIAALVGPLEGPLQDIGGGRWRAMHGLAAADAPPVHGWQERRKFLARGERGSWLVKFVGLGRGGRQKVACARALARAGFGPEVAGECHGFIIERWRDDMAPLTAQQLADAALRERLGERLADYIAFRALRFPAAADSGATLPALCEMAMANCSEAFGSEFAAAWLPHRVRSVHLGERVRRVRTDNRMHAWEWLLGERELLKTDAVDHHAGHDLVGCQDPAWDVAGAATEFALSGRELFVLLDRLGQRGCRIDVELLEFCLPAYLAFQLGYFHQAASEAGTSDEGVRLRCHAGRYARALRAQLAHGRAPAAPTP